MDVYDRIRAARALLLAGISALCVATASAQEAGSGGAAASGDEDLASKDRASLPLEQQKARALEILAKGGSKGDIGRALRAAELDAHFKVLNEIRGPKVAWGVEVHEQLGKAIGAQQLVEQIESLQKAQLLKGVRIVGYDADADGQAYALATFRVVDVVREIVKEKDWERLEYVFKSIEKQYPRDIAVIGTGSLAKNRPAAATAQPQVAELGPFPADWLERWRKAKLRMGTEFDAAQKQAALDMAVLRGQVNLLLQLKGMMDMEDTKSISSLCPMESVRKAFTIGQLTGVRYTNVTGVMGGHCTVNAVIRLRTLVEQVRKVNNFETLTRDEQTVLAAVDRDVEASGDGYCDPDLVEQTKPAWVPIGEVR